MVELILATTALHRDMCRSFIEQHHSYVPSYKSVGRRIDWLVNYEGRFVGMIGIGSATYPPCKDVLLYLRLSKQEYREQFNSFANNWRFCLAVSIKNLGTQVLKHLRAEAPRAWGDKYGDSLKYLMTFVGGGNSGAVYKADNWMLVGRTAGLPPHLSSSMKWHTRSELRTRFVKPTGENKKLIFLKAIN